MKLSTAATLIVTFFASSSAFTPAFKASAVTRPTSLNILPKDTEDVVDKIQRLVEEETTLKVDEKFDKIVKSKFPGAINNNDLQVKVVEALAKKGYTAQNTLLCTSLCCDELARQLEDDFVKVYGNNFSLGGLSGFPFAGNTGFGAMAAHIPDGGYCLVVYGPHVGVSQDGTVGKVERSGIALLDNCCGSAIAASNYVGGITNGSKDINVGIKSFTDFQQNVVQELILPHGKRLEDAENRMVELPYALYDSQDLLMRSIVAAGAGGAKKGLVLLGGIQINTSPGTLDYFHPLRFDYMDNKGVVVEDMLSKLTKRSLRQRLFGKLKK